MMNLERRFVWDVLESHVKEDHLRRHCLTVEIALRAYARKWGQDENYWGAVGALHEVDFEKYPEEHLKHTGEFLSPAGYDKEFIRHILSHDRAYPSEKRDLLDRTLLACDETPGFVLACCLVRPGKSLQDMQAKSIMKKMKDKAYARGCDREFLTSSAEALGVPFKEHADFIRVALAEALQDQRFFNIHLITDEGVMP